MSLTASRTRLAAVSKELALRWQETKSEWRDARAAEFEQTYMQELLAQVDKTLLVMEKLDELLNRVRTDCE